MKKTWLTLAGVLVIFGSMRAQIVISEIMYNPPEGGTDSLEYIELHNPTNAAVDVSGWNFPEGFAFTFPASSTINPNAYVVIAKSATAFQTVFGFPPHYVWDPGGALTNTPGEDIQLSNGSTIVDVVNYTNAAPWPPGANGNGNSLVLCNSNADNNDPANWQDASTSTGVTINGKLIFANPGAASNCATAINALTDNFSVAEGSSPALAVLTNDVLPNPVTGLTITSPPAHGAATANPDNTVTYTPTAGHCGPDAFTYQVCDANGCDTAVANITVQCFTPYEIADVVGVNAEGVATSSGITAELQGIVYGVNVRASATGLQFTLVNDDNSAGINVFSPTQTFGYTVQEGDELVIQGTIGQFNGLTQIVPVSITLTTQGNPPAQPEEVVTPGEATESRLIKINFLHLVDPAEWATGTGAGFSARAVSNDHPQDTILIRVDNDVTDLFNSPAPTGEFNLTGIGGQFDNSQPFTAGYQIQPRYSPDLSPVGSANYVDFSANVRLTPNPAGAFVDLKTDLAFDRVQLLGASGNLLRSWQNPGFNERLSLGDLPAGPYFIRFVKANAAWTTRIMKM